MNSKNLVGAVIGAVIGFALSSTSNNDAKSKKEDKTDLTPKDKKGDTKNPKDVE